MRKEGYDDKDLLFENSGVVFSENNVEFKCRWDIFLKKVEPLQKLHA